MCCVRVYQYSHIYIVHENCKRNNESEEYRCDWVLEISCLFRYNAGKDNNESMQKPKELETKQRKNRMNHTNYMDLKWLFSDNLHTHVVCAVQCTLCIQFM